MIEHIVFISYLYLFLFSTIGYGYVISKFIIKDHFVLNIGWFGIFGFFLMCFISVISSFFFAHNFLHNSIIHIIGLLLFFKNFLNKNNFRELKYFFIISLFLLIGAYIYKNHDDFSYYHLTYALNLSENSFMVGTGNFSHGFRTFSSLFYYHSNLYMPFIKYHLFHIGPFYLIIFFNFIILNNLFKKPLSDKHFKFDYYISLISLVFINIVFYRLSEHGTDRSAQVLLVLIFLLFLEIYYKNKKLNLTETYINTLILLIVLAATMKAIYYLYLILIPILFFRKKINPITFIKNQLIFSSIIFFFIFFNLTIYYLNTGCFLYPAETTCVLKSEWSIPIEEVKKMSIHYEWWAKAGGGPNFSSDIEKSEYIKNFVWLETWINRHFFNKVFDTLGGTLLICILMTLTFFYYSKIKGGKFRVKFKLAYIILLIFLLEWFFNHPSMRYGGYILVGLPIILFFSSVLSNFEIKKNMLFKISVFFVILSLIIFNYRNLVRINKEIKFYGYEPLKSPYFFVDKVNSEVIFKKDNLKIFSPIKSHCWASQTPCSNYKSLILKDFLWMKKVVRND